MPKTRRDAQVKVRRHASRLCCLPLPQLCAVYNRYGPCEVKRGPKPCLVVDTLTKWMDECANQTVCPTLSEIKDEAQGMADKRTSAQNPSLPCKFGNTWWKLFKKRNSEFVPQNVESQRASPRLTPQQRTKCFNNHLKPGLEKVAYNPCHIWNEDASGFFRRFSTVGPSCETPKGR